MEIKVPTGWKNFKVNKAFEFIPTTSHSKGEMNYKEGDNSSIYNIHYGDIHAKYSIYVDFEKDKIPHLKDAKNGFDRNLLRSGDLVMVDASEDLEGVGTCIEIKNLHNKKCVAGLHTFALRDSKKHTVPGYRGLMLKHKAVKHRMQQVSTYSKVFGMSKKSFSDIDLILPPLSEQQKIVEVLETWDECIEKLSAVIKLKKKVKKGFMQKLLTGEIRIQGFTGGWKTVKLGDICEIKTGKKDNQNKIENGLYPFFVRSPNIERIDSYSYDGEAILIPGEGNIGQIFHYINGKFDYHQRVYKISDFSNTTCGKYIYYYFVKNFAKQAKQNSVKATVDSLRLPSFQNFKIYIPLLEEQTAIANILTTADQEIEALEKKRAFIEAQKKFLLNNLVTGKIRLPEFTNAN